MVGTVERPLKVAVVGAGPSGIFAAGACFDGGTVAQVDVFERLPTPYGLVRGGVAPDHPKIKSVARALERTLKAPGVRFFGHVALGKDVSIDELLAAYDAVILATGAEASARLGIPGEDLSGSVAATDFVGWYNGHPDHRHHDIPLHASRAVVVGVGNVAVDVARILACDPDHLAATDVAPRALDALRNKGIREVVVLGRRGPAQATFAADELRELSRLPTVDVRVWPGDDVLDPLSEIWLATKGDKFSQANVAFLRERAAAEPSVDARCRVTFRFLASPVEVRGENGAVTGVVIEHNEIVGDPEVRLDAKSTGRREVVEAGLVLRAVGYRGNAVPGVPYDAKRGTIPNDAGRVLGADGQPIRGLYVVGWAKRGPNGLIGTNKADSKDTVAAVKSDWVGAPDTERPEVASIVARRTRVVDWAAWERIDAAEVAAGAASGRVRTKFDDVDAMLAAALAT